ncbi:hypothetical protein JHN63_42940 [Streptomyces sp. MBT65]|uniref:hypothetical protein n=1 Tax=Streptomyces sp. MBT65 TaxID=1488395 RepID=UPI001909176F|nr:hypothetical protein [Streptomyces sp. MBT65]MBK3580433.1 hypothetical protein [Streptomyces sp. MBT65]
MDEGRNGACEGVRRQLPYPAGDFGDFAGGAVAAGHRRHRPGVPGGAADAVEEAVKEKVPRAG